MDNLGGASVLGRVLKVDHTRYKRKDDEKEMEQTLENGGKGDVGPDGRGFNGRGESETKSEEDKRPLLKEERELAALIRDHDEDDPMKGYLVQEKKEEVAEALARMEKAAQKPADGKRKHRHHHKHREQQEKASQDEDRRRRHRHERKRSRSSR